MAANAWAKAPCVALQLRASSWSGDAAEIQAFEARAAAAASPFGRVLDVRLSYGDGSTRTVKVYFSEDAAAVCCATRFACNGVTLEGFAYENFEAPAHVTFRDLPKPKDPAELARDVGVECGEYGRVLDARFEEEVVIVTFASSQGAAAAAIALDGAAFDGFRCAACMGSQDGAPSCVVRGPLDDIGDDDLSQMEAVGDVEEACNMLGEVRSVASRDGAILVTYDENRDAATCAAAMHGRIFDGREVQASARLRGGYEAEAELCAAVVQALSVKAPTVEKIIQKKASPEETLKKAIQALRKGVLASPSDAQLRCNLAGALTRIGGVGELEEACRHASYACRLKPDDAWGHYRLGVAQFKKGDVAKASAALRLASSLAPERADFADIATKADEAAVALLDPMDAFAAKAEAEAKKALVDSEAKAKREKETRNFGTGKRKLEDSDDEGELINVNSRAHCYICKQWGHSKKDCPLARCQYCHEIGHRKADCPLFTQALSNAADEEKKTRRKQGYEKKKLKRKEEWTKMLRDKTGLDGFAALYRVLGLPERKLSTASEIKKAYHKRSLQYHPDKHPSDPDGAKERFLEIKAAYELLLEGMETGGAGMGGAVFSAGELTDGAAAAALQEKVKALEKKVKASAAWSG